MFGKQNLEGCLQLYRGTAQSEFEPVACMALQLSQDLVSDSVIICQLQTHACTFGMEFIDGIVLQWQREGTEPSNGHGTNLVKVFILTRASQESETLKNSIDEC